MTLQAGTLLHHRYRILDILGQGGMGAVYRALDERLGVEVAVKENLFLNEAYARQFRREASTLALLRHPALPRVTDHFEAEGNVQYLAMDFVDGQDLRQRLELGGQVSERDVLIIGIAICDALTYLHTRHPKVIHRDIKPGNIRITPAGKVFLVDFGLVKMLQSDQSTTAGARAMTPGYSPPEQYGTSRTEPRSDIYSLGATLYAALTGAVPEDGLARVMGDVHLTGVRKHNPRVSRQMAAVIEKAMAIQPSERYQSAEEFKNALYKINDVLKYRIGELTVSAPAPMQGMHKISTRPRITVRSVSTPGEEGFPLPRPARRWGVALLLVLSVALLAFGLWALSGFSGLAGERPAAGASPGTVTGNPSPSAVVSAGQFTPSAPPPAAAMSITATPAALPASVNVASAGTAAAAASPTRLPDPSATDADLAPTESPWDDEPRRAPGIGGSTGEIAFVSKAIGPLQIWSVNVDGSDLRQLTRRPSGACQPRWSSTGERFVFTSPCLTRREWFDGTNLILANADGTGMLELTTELLGDYDPAWANDDIHVAFSSLRNRGNPRIHVLTLEDTRKAGLTKLYTDLKVLEGKGSQNMQPAWSPDNRQLVFVSDAVNGTRLWMMDADGNNLRPFSPDDGYYSHPQWSPDGSTIVYTYRGQVNGVPNLYRSPAGEFGGRSIFIDKAPRMDADISPDGLWLVYEAWPNGEKHEIWYADINGGQEKKIPIGIDLSSAEFSPAWRPALMPSGEFH